MKEQLRFIVYCPPRWRNRHPIFGNGPIAAMAEHSRPVYRVLDCAKLGQGNSPELPFHSTAEIVANNLDYLSACKKARELNEEPGAQSVFGHWQALRALGFDSLKDYLTEQKRMSAARIHLLAVGENV